MKRLFIIIAFFALAVSCSKIEEIEYCETGDQTLVLTGYSSIATKTNFGTPDNSTIPYMWTSGDYIWLGSEKSQAIAEDCLQAKFKWNPAPSTIGDFYLFYNMTGEHKTAKVLAEQSADANLGNDGDFGYAVADEYGVFCLDHKTSFIWFDTKSDDELPKLVSITVTAQEGLALAGEREFDYKNNQWNSTVTNGSNQIVLQFGEGVELASSNDGIFAAMVTLPAEIAGTQLTVVYTFADGSTFTEVKNPSKNLVMGDTQRIRTTIAASDLVQPEPELDYELRVLTFEDADVKFTPYSLDYASVDISKWSELIDEPQYGGPLTYGDTYSTEYTWWDENNTDLMHIFPSTYGSYCYWTGGHAISNYVGEGYSNDDRNTHIAKYYGEDYVTQWQGNDQMLGWMNVQFMIPVAAHSGENFAVHYGYKDSYSMVENLPEISFADGEPRVIDHMYVTNTNYALNQLMYGVGSEAGNTFGGSYTGPTEESWFKVTAMGFASIDDDEPIAEVDFYLLNGTEPVLDWQKWDLSGLGKVAKVQFNMSGSDDMSGGYGQTIPAYFAYDDVAVRFDK